MNAAARKAVRTKAVKKGDPLQTARLAGIMAAKQTAELIPLCHQIALTSVDVDIRPTATGYALRARAATVSQGVFVTAALRDPATGDFVLPGAVVDLSGETTARLQIKVQAPPWMPVARIRIYAGREEVDTIELDPGDTLPVRYDQNRNIPLPDGEADSFFIVLVETAGPGTPVLGETDPSFTNPLFYDGNGDGDWSP